jgi:hypothetical protein
VEAEVARLTKESSLQGLGAQHSKDDMKRKATTTKVSIDYRTLFPARHYHTYTFTHASGNLPGFQKMRLIQPAIHIRLGG